MQRKNKLILSLILIVILVAGLGIIIYKDNPFIGFSNNYLSSKDDGDKSFLYHANDIISNNGESFDFGGFDGKWSLIDFISHKDNEITISDNTKISSGDFCVVVLDSDYKIIANTKSNSSNSNNKVVSFTTPKDGKYIIRIVGKKASGNFKIEVNSAKNINISHNNFWS